MKYPSIDSVFERDQQGRFLAAYARPEFEYLANLPWLWTEKVNGTNVRMYFPSMNMAERARFRGTEHEHVKGRTDDAQFDPKLLNACIELLRSIPLEDAFSGPDEVTLYGEGYGAGIHKGGGYRPDPSFVLFDVRVGEWWLRRPDVEDVGIKLGLDVVPVVAEMTVNEAVESMREMATGMKERFESGWPGAVPEGIVGRPKIDLFDRRGERLITKLKFRDFAR